jgi:WhiB family transcriptional regulator, redox-sensing transcriptional regulator
VTADYSKCPSCGIVRQTNALREPKVCRDCKRYGARPAPRGDWLDDAACRAPDVDPSWFHSEDPQGIDRLRAINVCVACPVRSECLQHAIKVDERYGIWGGLTATERMQLAYPRAR